VFAKLLSSTVVVDTVAQENDCLPPRTRLNHIDRLLEGIVECGVAASSAKLEAIVAKARKVRTTNKFFTTIRTIIVSED
jgi:hypothetical protein